jgi:hypothetical protein
MNKIFVFSLSWLIYLVFASSAKAQPVTLSVSPPVVEIMLAPNKQVTQIFTLKTEGENLEVIPELHLAKPADSTGHIEIDPAPYDQTTAPLTISLAGSNTTPILTFEAQSTDVAKDVYLALVFVPKTNLPASERTTPTTPSIAALILVTINPSGVMPIDLEITAFSPPYLHDSWNPLNLTATIKNNVDIMIRPEAIYEIISPSGNTLFSLRLDPNLILGHSSRLLTPQLTWSPTWKNLGPHTLRLRVATQGGTKLTQVEKTIWIMPIRITVIGFIIIVFLLTLIYKRTRFKVA